MKSDKKKGDKKYRRALESMRKFGSANRMGAQVYMMWKVMDGETVVIQPVKKS